MKKIFTVLFVAAALMVGNKAQAQVNVGVKGGLNLTNMSTDNDLFDVDNQAGFFIGPTIKISLPVVGLGIDASALYDQRSAKLKAEVSNQNIASSTLKQQSIQIPVNVRYGFGLGDAASIYFFAGPQFGFNVGDKDQKIFDEVDEWKLKDSNFSVNVGLGVMLINHLQVSANYNIACGKTGDVTFLNGAAKAATGKNNAWQIAVAYYF